MSGLLVEGGIYFLLLFTPLAFGGIETWAIGVIQIAATIVFVAWAAGEGSPWSKSRGARTGSNNSRPRRPLRVIWVCVGLFILLALLQVTQLPPEAIRTLAPATWSLYAQSIPGYAEGNPFRSEELPGWLLKTQKIELSSIDATSIAIQPPELPIAEAPWSVSAPPWRTLSVYPHLTWERLTLLLSFSGVFAAVVGHFRTRQRLQRLMAVCVGLVALVSIVGIIQKLTWNGKLYWVREGTYPNPFGPFVHRNNFAGFAVTVLPLAICLSFAALAKVRRGQRDATPPFLLFGFASVVTCAGIFYSLSRAGMLTAAFAVSIVGALLYYYGERTLELALLGAFFVLAGVFVVWIGSSEEIVQRVQTMTEGETTPSMAMRYTTWENSLSLVGKNWLLGTGLGTFRFAFMRYAPPGRNWWLTADNEFLEVFTDTGFTGGLIALTGLGTFFAAVLRPRRFRGRSGRYAFVGLVVGIVALLVHSTVHSNLQMPAIALFVVVLGGTLLNLVRLYEREEAPGVVTLPEPAAQPGAARSLP